MKYLIIILAASLMAGATLAQTIDVTSIGVGIGTPTPAHKLEISGLSSSSTQDAIHVSGGTASNINGFIMAGGTSGNSPIAQIANTDGSNYAGWLLLYKDGTRKVQITASPGYPTYFNSGGNLGIGTTNPGKAFEVVGEIVGRNSAGSSSPAVDIQTASDGAHFWLNNSYDPTNPGSGWARIMTFNAASGYVGIATTAPSYLLTVNGPVRASQFIADVNTYSDFVFKPSYKLASLAEVEATIKRDGHLPDIPAEAEVKEHGVDLANQQAKLLQKVEEITLYLLDHEKDLTRLKRENAELRQKLADLQSRRIP